jgi:hypothetical protein
MGILGPTAGESFAAHMGVPDEYPGGNELCRDLDDAMYEAGLWLLREQQAADPVLRAMMDDRYRLLELVDGVSVGSLPPGRRLSQLQFVASLAAARGRRVGVVAGAARRVRADRRGRG